MKKQIEVKNENEKKLNAEDSKQLLNYLKDSFDKETAEQRKDYEESKKRAIKEYKMQITINWLMILALSSWIGLLLGQFLSIILNN